MLSILRRMFSKPRAAGEPLEVWMTFDDGPDAVQTPRVLDVLKAHGIQATFFIMGQRAESYPGIVARVAEEGHRIGNHSYSHPTLTKLTATEIEDELIKTERLIGHHMRGQKIFRPPYGRRNAKVDRTAAGLGYRTVMWNVETDDWDPKNWPAKWIDLGMRNLKRQAQAVVINHDIHDATARHLDQFIRRIAEVPHVRFMPPGTLPVEVAPQV
jgi:peptidoglycan-N-acetylglucosamine deacetylase